MATALEGLDERTARRVPLLEASFISIRSWSGAAVVVAYTDIVRFHHPTRPMLPVVDDRLLELGHGMLCRRQFHRWQLRQQRLFDRRSEPSESSSSRRCKISCSGANRRVGSNGRQTIQICISQSTMPSHVMGLSAYWSVCAKCIMR